MDDDDQFYIKELFEMTQHSSIKIKEGCFTKKYVHFSVCCFACIQTGLVTEITFMRVLKLFRDGVSLVSGLEAEHEIETVF